MAIPFLGTAVKAAFKVKRTIDLPELIKNAKNELNLPLLEKYTGIQRFMIASSLLDGYLQHSLATENVDQHHYIKVVYLRRLKEELTMAKDSLQHQYATKLETAALGVALKEVAITLDEQIDSFYQSANQKLSVEVENTRKKFQNTQYQAELKFKDTINNIEGQMEVFNKKFQNQIVENESRINRLQFNLNQEIDKRHLQQVQKFQELLSNQNDHQKQLQTKILDLQESLIKQQEKYQKLFIINLFLGGIASIIASVCLILFLSKFF